METIIVLTVINVAVLATVIYTVVSEKKHKLAH